MLFLEGAAGTGKTRHATAILQKWLVEDQIDPQHILVMVPTRALGRPYQTLLAGLDVPNAFDVQIVTYNGLAQRALSLYWSLVASRVMAAWDGREPLYLTVETAQYFLDRFLEPEFKLGRFDSISLNRPRLVAQILSNLSSAAVNGYAVEEAAERLTQAWIGHSSRPPVYRAAVEVALNYRQYCLEHALLDFALQIELFQRVLLREPLYIDALQQNTRYLIADNVEENFPAALDFINGLLDSVDDACLVYDDDGGFRVLLGASPAMARQLEERTAQKQTFDTPHQQMPQMSNLVETVDRIFAETDLADYAEASPLDAVEITYHAFYPQMVSWTAEKVIELVNNGVPPQEIVILAPFLGDSLRFVLFNALDSAGIPYLSHRPSRAVRDEPAARAVLTLMKLAYADVPPPAVDVAQMLVTCIEGLDPIRAELLTQIVYRPKSGELGTFDVIKPQMQSRITYAVGERYEKLRNWLMAFMPTSAETPPDHFLRHLFDLLAQPDYRFHTNLESGRVIAQLINSAYQFRLVLGDSDWNLVAREYIQLVGDGVLAAVHLTSWLDEGKDAVLIAPAYTFLMRDRYVAYQFWLDVGSNAWYERLEQPVTHPYVLHRDYPIGEQWTDDHNEAAQSAMLRRLILGLLRRCRQQVFVGFADLGEQGFEQRGPLLRIFNRILSIYGNEG